LPKRRFAQIAVGMNIYYVYMLSCADGSYYVGITNDLERRIGEHNFGIDPKCYTFRRRPLVLVHASDFCNVDDAIAWEKQLKGWTRAKKIALIDANWPQIHKLARCMNDSVAVSPFDSAQGDTAARGDGAEISVPLDSARGDAG